MMRSAGRPSTVVLREAVKAAQRTATRRAREIQELEETIKGLELRLAGLGMALEQAGGAQQVERVRTLGIEYSQVETELQDRLAEWTEAAG